MATITINGKSFLECNEDDLSALIGNPDYRENDYIDYKQNFSFLETRDSSDKERKVAEFRSDVCSFANADGGYLIYGISDDNGCASALVGIDIPNDNTDRFELERRNNLTPILPKTPSVQFSFIKLNNGKYIVVIYVKKDGYTPYIHLFSEKDYKIYKRSGNQKKIISYTELKNMFNQSLSLEKEMYNYRLERINYFKSQDDTEQLHFSRFLMLHFIPENFLDSNYNQNVFALNRLKGIQFNNIFSPVNCHDVTIPNVDGVRCVPNSSYYQYRECSVKNNGVVEVFLPLTGIVYNTESHPTGRIAWRELWNYIVDIFYKYCDIFSTLSFGKTYLSISILGCKDVITENKEFDYFYTGKIDRNQILCNPIVIENMDDDDKKELLLKKLYVDYLISIGVKYHDDLIKYMKELYED